MKLNNKNYKRRYNTNSDRMISYAQNGEDVVIQRIFRKKRGFYIDIGAADPIIDSVTKYFYDKGWNGINVEPINKNYIDLVKDRPRDINLNIGIGEEHNVLTFYEFKKYNGWSTFSKEIALIHKNNGASFIKKTIAVKTLKEICDQYVNTEIDFLKIDVEGFEKNIIHGGDWQKYRPTLIIIETDKHKEITNMLNKQNYILTLNDGLNLFFLKKEKKQLKDVLSIPANVCDYYSPYYFVHEIEKYDDELKRHKVELDKYRNEYSKLVDLYKKQGLQYENKLKLISNIRESRILQLLLKYLKLQNKIMSILRLKKNE